ncbi:DUF983 domain-containing protein [Peteryoungia desertarenae]|uniref:DUF983 domain-containing protein n=1 Tax=Peteryoungia desertarenae TaxID=1813451 RepID=A0ABX6QNE5_9HYPH|nr:DUF983 domain-containing protein [Peteryoungia desertarenae]QLF70133.1 DUF983 domain-containing protein [Peteryoungia desertarenae]
MTGSPRQQITRYGGHMETERPVGRSMKRGLLNSCPACGSGRLFQSYLKTVDNCASCGEAMHHHRADDLPPYIVIMILGHVLVGGYMMTDLVFPVSEWIHLAIWAPIGIITSLLTLQPIKGAVVGLQWALKMHGFGGHADDVEEQHAHSDL